ncbi:MAG: thiol-disulfide oxidoreductase DCC family protein [Spirosomataceae bacterium]
MIVFFDGVCLLCARFIQIILQKDKKRAIRVAPLQWISDPRLKNQFGDSVMVLTSDGQWLGGSDAALYVLVRLPKYTWLKMAYILPKSFRNCLYSFIAKKRYHWFGQSETCRVPTQEEKKTFLTPEEVNQIQNTWIAQNNFS